MLIIYKIIAKWRVLKSSEDAYEEVIIRYDLMEEEKGYIHSWRHQWVILFQINREVLSSQE